MRPPRERAVATTAGLTTAGPTTAGTASPITRRTFLAGAGTAAALAGVAGPALLPRYAFATPNDPGRGDVLVVVFLRGAADGLSLVVPYTDTNPGGYYTFRGQGTGNDISVPPPGSGPGSALELGASSGGHDFGLHPALGGTDGHGGLMGVWEAGDLAIVHAVGMPAGESDSRSHFEAQDTWERGTADQAVTDGWLARYLAGDPAEGIPALARGSSIPFSLRGEPRAMAMTSIDAFGVQGFADVPRATTALEALHPGDSDDPARRVAAETLAAVALVEDEDPQQHAPDPDPYPTTGIGAGLGAHLRETAMLVRADVGLRAACVDLGGWDMHDLLGRPTEGDLFEKATGLGDALGAFWSDLGPLGEEVTVLVLSEFGRTLEVNGNGGTDHGRGSCCFVLGGAVQGGLYGDYPPGPLSHGPEGDLAVTTDVRTVLTEVLAARGDAADLGAVFPTYTHPGDLGLYA